MSETAYRRPIADVIATSEFEVKRSRFLGFIARASNEKEARDFVSRLRSEYPDARHHCSAFICHVDAAQPVERSSDDGEPSGTAGFPMLEVLKGSGLLDIVAVVVRYFGGTKLGTGGLVRAYSDSVSLTLPGVQAVTREQLETFTFDLRHDTAGRIEGELRRRGIQILDTHYHAAVTYTVGIAPGYGEALVATLAELTAGEVEPARSDTLWIER